MIDTIMPSAYRFTQRKARKAHRCCECGGIIQPGEQYTYHSGIWDGDPDSYKICPDCEQLRKEYNATREYDELAPFGYLIEWLTEDHRGNNPFIKRFIAIKRKRGANVSKYLEELLEKPE